MNFNEAEQFLYSLSNLPRKQYMSDTKKCGIYLKRLQFFLDILGNPEQNIPRYIHIAGTSGKGSLASYMQAIFIADKKTTGMYISPHPTHIRERWNINNRCISKKDFTHIVAELKQAFDTYVRTSPYDPLSFFEITTALTLLYFAKQRVEWVILETGCGGRYDSTNVIARKDLAIITNIGLDHTEILGPTKEIIAQEKAGIIQHGAPVITAERFAKIRAIIQEEAKKNKSDFYLSDGKAHIISSTIEGTDFIYKDAYYHTGVPGIHQVKNALLAIDAAELLGIHQKAILSGIANATQPLRMEIARRNPTIILDGAHNQDKIKTTVQSMRTLLSDADTFEPKKTNIHLILSFSNNKNLRPMIRQLLTLNPLSIACTRNTVNHFRKVAHPNDIAQICKTHTNKAKIETFIDPVDALHWSQKQAKKSDIILSTGSIFTTGELRGYLT